LEDENKALKAQVVMNKLFCDLKTDEEKSAFFLSGRGYETGIIAVAIQNDVAMAYHRCAEYKKELAALQAECEKYANQLRQQAMS
jgi:hypothetical protein